MSTGSELSDDDRQNPPGQSAAVLHPSAAPLPIQADDSAHVSPAATQSRSLAHRSDEPVRLAFWQLWSELSAGSRVPSGRMTNVDPARSAKKTGSEANVGALPPMPWVQRCAAGRLVAQATSTRWAAWCPATVGANVTFTDDDSPAPRLSSAALTVKALASAAGAGSARPTSRRTFS